MYMSFTNHPLQPRLIMSNQDKPCCHGYHAWQRHHTRDAETAFAHEEGGIAEQHIGLVVERNVWVRRVTP